MEKKEFMGKLYNYSGVNSQCPIITINGKPFCVLKDCFVRALLKADNYDCHTLPRDGNEHIQEAPADWENRCDLRVETGYQKPEEWI
jgi:hypothetical protein